MTTKEKFMLLWVLVSMVLVFLAHRYLGCAAQVLQNLVAYASVSTFVLGKCAVGFLGSLFLP